MEQIFQSINKQMLETTYTLKLSQLLKIALDFKKYMWQKLKPNVATLIETHVELNTIAIEVDNQMAVIQVQIKLQSGEKTSGPKLVFKLTT